MLRRAKLRRDCMFPNQDAGECQLTMNWHFGNCANLERSIVGVNTFLHKKSHSTRLKPPLTGATRSCTVRRDMSASHMPSWF